MESGQVNEETATIDLVSSVHIILDSKTHTAQCPETIPYPLTEAT